MFYSIVVSIAVNLKLNDHEKYKTTRVFDNNNYCIKIFKDT